MPNQESPTVAAIHEMKRGREYIVSHWPNTVLANGTTDLNGTPASIVWVLDSIDKAILAITRTTRLDEHPRLATVAEVDDNCVNYVHWVTEPGTALKNGTKLCDIETAQALLDQAHDEVARLTELGNHDQAKITELQSGTDRLPVVAWKLHDYLDCVTASENKSVAWSASGEAVRELVYAEDARQLIAELRAENERLTFSLEVAKSDEANAAFWAGKEECLAEREAARAELGTLRAQLEQLQSAPAERGVVLPDRVDEASAMDYLVALGLYGLVHVHHAAQLVNYAFDEVARLNPAPATAAQPVADEREAFEAELIRQWPGISLSRVAGSKFNRYAEIDTQLLWEGWQARAALSPAEQPVPEGWKLVPAEPTSKMTFVGQAHRYESAWSIGAIYREMLDAAPLAPAQQQKGVES